MILLFKCLYVKMISLTPEFNATLLAQGAKCVKLNFYGKL